jgi:two-component system KDP operon response regulator KdpE
VTPEPPRATILVVDDDPSIRRALVELLTARGHRVTEAASGAEAIRIARAIEPGAILLDLLLPDRNGVEVCQELRGWYRGPIIVLSAREAERDKVEVLDNGADDYVTKPFGVDELVARIRANLRRSRADSGDAIVVDGLRLDQTRRLVTVDGQEVHLTPTEYAVLRVLMVNAGRVVTHATLLREVWGPTYADAHETLRVFVAQLRRKLERGGSARRFIRTEPGVGYRFRDA